MWKMISYPIEDNGINWPGCPGYSWEPVKSFEDGALCNTATVSIFGHFGTHMDAPRHYKRDGLRIGDLPFFESFIYDRVLLLDIPKGAGEKVMAGELSPYAEAIGKADLLCIRTGADRMRREDPETYNTNGPAISAEAARYLMDNFRGSLKAVALDFLSLAAPSDTKDGDLAHQYMLGVYHDGYILIIEDCDLSGLPAEGKGIRRVFAIPPRFTGVDSAQVSMFAEIEPC